MSNKPNICKFRKEHETNIRRHITSIHHDEQEVRAFMMLSEENPRKREVLSQIRRDGDFKGFKENEMNLFHVENRKCIKSEDKKGNLKKLHSLKTALSAHVNKTAAKSLLQLKRKKLVVLPSMEDIQKLNSYLLKQITYNYELLMKEFNLNSWRRPGDLERSLITNLENLSGLSEDTDAFKKLNDADREFVKDIKRFAIRGKLARGVPVLLNKIMFNSLNLIIKYRKEAGVEENNPFIFGLPQNTETKTVFRPI
ncbi:hypothetical protein JTB14_034608 [Gonioctena quinquepunctata]|nr:hypothetical protein JTB14_034608 [Gonioctena quinquepunctata]